MEKHPLYTEEYLEEHGAGYYLICKRLAPEWGLSSVSKEDLEALEGCIHDFDEAFQYKVVYLGTTERLEFLSEWGGKRKGGRREYGASLVLLVKRESGIPDAEEANARVRKLEASEMRRFLSREQSKGRKGGRYRGFKEYTRRDLVDLGVYLHRVCLRMAVCWMERHGGRRRVFQESYRSFLVDEKILELLRISPESGKETEMDGTWFVQEGVIGWKAFH